MEKEIFVFCFVFIETLIFFFFLPSVEFKLRGGGVHEELCKLKETEKTKKTLRILMM